MDCWNQGFTPPWVITAVLPLTCPDKNLTLQVTCWYLSITYSSTIVFPDIKESACYWSGNAKPGHPLNLQEVYISPLNQKTRNPSYWAPGDAANQQQVPQESKIWTGQADCSGSSNTSVKRNTRNQRCGPYLDGFGSSLLAVSAP